MKKNRKKAESEKTLSPNAKKIFFCSAVILALLVTAGLIFILSPSKHYTVAFYKIPDQQKQGITSTLEKIASEKKITLKYITYDSEKSLKSQLPIAKKPQLLFTLGGRPLEDALEKVSSKTKIQAELTQGLTSSMKSAIKREEDNIKALPLLSSHLEVDIDLNEFRNSDIKQINTWKDVERFMNEQKKRKEAPMIFAGGNSALMLDIMGAFAESIDGVSSYNQAVKILKDNEKNFNPVRTAIKLCDEPDSPLATTVEQLKNWYQKGLLHPGIFSFQNSDVEAFASSRFSSVLFMTLESHRAARQNTISRFTSIYLPSEHSPNSRIFTGNIYYAIPLSKSKNSTLILKELMSPACQESLSRSTGLAPVLAQCRTPDKQADDARYWIAATEAPLPGLSNEIYLTKEQKNALASEISARIRN
ncbi:MAG: hypothetical protein IJ257_05630 [Treponema sp.]|nr:hypothetical protein [Treponema sp.]